MMNWLQSIFTSALFKGSKTRVLCGLTLLALVVVLSAAALPNDTLSSPQTIVTYYACVNNTSGAITIVSKGTKCQTGSHKIHWNQQGPIGPQGPAGPQGPQGPQGPAGVSQGYFASAGNVNIASSNQQLIPVVQTAPIQATGVYIITASETAIFANGDTVACIITTVDGLEGNLFAVYGPSATYQYVNMNVTDKLSLNAGDQIRLSCVEYNNNPATISYNASISAIFLNSVQSSSIHHTSRPPLPKALPHK